jgi:hypothetical protein
MAADALRAPLFVSDHRVLLVSDAQAVLRPMAPGSTEVNRSSGIPAQPYQAGRGLILTAPARPDSLAEVTPAEVARRPARRERARLHVVLGTGPVDYALAGLWGDRTRAEHLTWASILVTCALPPPLSAHGPGVRLAGAARAATPLKTWRSWSCDMRSQSCAARSPAPSRTGLTMP